MRCLSEWPKKKPIGEKERKHALCVEADIGRVRVGARAEPRGERGGDAVADP
jgi:hypothetical protein